MTDGGPDVYVCTEDGCDALFLKRQARDGHQWVHGGRDPDSDRV